jgi:DNA polymerase-3 subunit delta'
MHYEFCICRAILLEKLKFYPEVIMGFDTLLGNRQLKENLTASLAKNRISHFYLISGPAGSGKHTLARLLAAAILCKDHPRPCLECAACRKVMDGVHPDFITVEDPEHKNLPVKLVRQAREDAFIRPNEADYKIYLFPQEMGIEGQNALLKILEEPPGYGVFLLLSENPEKLLPTVRSRCTQLQLTALPEGTLKSALAREFPQARAEELAAAVERSGGFLGQARHLLQEGQAVSPQTEAFARAFAGKDALGLLQLLAPMEKWKRDQLIPELQQWQQLLTNALAYRAGLPAVSPLASALGTARSPRELMQAREEVTKCIEYAQGNVSCGAVCGYLSWVLR